MGLFDTFSENARQGLADIFGVGGMQDENTALYEQLFEASADARMIARQAEDAGYTNLTGQTSAYYFDPDNQVRQDQTRRAHDFYFNDPTGRRTVDLTNLYVFGKGVPKPKYRHQMQDKGAADSPGQRAIDAFWKDEENKITLTGFMAQYFTGLDVALQGQKFFTLHPAKGTLNQDGTLNPNRRVPEGQPALRVADIPENEIVDIIPHPQRRKITLYYKRQYQMRTYDFKSGTWNNTGITLTRYYRDWRFRTPLPESEWPVGWVKPPDNLVVEGVYIYHLAVNKTGEMRFGVTTMNSYLKWMQGLNQYMSSRMSMVMALAQLALRVKARGGPKAVSQVQQALSDISRLAQNIESAPGNVSSGYPGGLRTVRADQGRTKFAVENMGADMQPMVTDTNSAGAQGDISTMRGMVASGSGIGEHHLGGGGMANNAQSTSIDAPTGKLVDWHQELYETLLREVVGFNVILTSADLDPDKVEVQMPPVTQRDVSQVATSMAALIPVLDPHGENKALFRFVFGEILDAMGKVNTPELLDQIFGDEWRTPFETGQELLQQQAQMQQDAQTSGVSVKPGGRGDGRAAQSAQVSIRKAGELRSGPIGSRAGGDVPGGPAGAVSASGDRATARYQQRVAEAATPTELLEVLAGEPEEWDGLDSDMREIIREAIRGEEEDIEADVVHAGFALDGA